MAGPDLPIETGTPPASQTDTRPDNEERSQTHRKHGNKTPTQPVTGTIRHNPNIEEPTT